MPEIRPRPTLRVVPPPSPTAGERHPRTDLVDVFARLLPGVVVTPATFRSETALAGQLRVDPRRIREVRTARLVSPARAGRGWVYGPSEIRTLSVMLALLRLGAGLDELAVFFEVSPEAGDRDARSRAVSPIRLCAAFCERLAARMEEEIERLAALDRLIAQPEWAVAGRHADRFDLIRETIVK